MELRTEIDLQEASFKIDYSKKLMSIGSCFSDHFGNHLVHHKFNHLNNPAGISFNPSSISKLLETFIQKKSVLPTDLVEREGQYYHFDFHGMYSDGEPQILTNKINDMISKTHDHLSHLDVLIITLGTSFVYRLKSSDTIVNNCHKFPNQDFERILLTPSNIIKDLTPQFTKLKDLNPNLEIILTVSPVRHIRDGIVQNQRSKSHLIAAVHHLVEQNDYCHYFPAYELLMDELRDYRFYSEDMIHPSKQATNYVISRFIDSYLAENSKEQIAEIGKLKNNLSHRIMKKGSISHQKFVEQQIQSIESLEIKYPTIDFSSELKQIKATLL